MSSVDSEKAVQEKEVVGGEGVEKVNYLIGLESDWGRDSCLLLGGCGLCEEGREGEFWARVLQTEKVLQLSIAWG